MNHEDLTPRDEQLIRWIDGPPTSAPPADLDPDEARQERASTEAVAELLRRHGPNPVDPPYPDFFNSQLLKRIRADEMAPRPAPGGGALRWFRWLRSPWVAGVSTAVAAIAVVASLSRSAPQSGTRVLSVFSPEPNATATALATRDGTAVIIAVEGLEAFPSDRLIVGQLTDESEPLVASHSR